MQYFSGLGTVGIDKQRRFDMERVLQIDLVRFNMERAGAHTSYLSHSSHVRHVEKNLSRGEISEFYTWQMGRNLKNVAEFQISSHDRCGEL